MLEEEGFDRDGSENAGPDLRVAMVMNLIAFCLGCIPAGLVGLWLVLWSKRATELGDVEVAWTLYQLSYGVGFFGGFGMFVWMTLSL